jgi:hypothetical protein
MHFLINKEWGAEENRNSCKGHAEVSRKDFRGTGIATTIVLEALRHNR